MRVNTKYRTVIIRLYPTPKQEAMLKKAEEEVLKFLHLSRLELQKMLYHRMKEMGIELSMYTLSLLTQRFTGSLGEKAIIPFDTDYNAKFVNDNGIWFVEVQLFKGKGNRIRIPIAKTELPYYEAIDEIQGLPFIITHEDDKWFAYVSVPVKAEPNDLVVGVDFNLRMWVASPYEGRPVFFDVREYDQKIERLQRLRTRYQKRGEEENVKEFFRKMREIVKLAHGNFLARIIERYGVCNLAIEDIETIYKLTEKDSRMINNWLYSKTALRQFAVRAMAKGFNVIEVDPKDTSRLCHKCGNPVRIYGKHERLIACETCGYRDYNRDLNAARNIAKRGSESRNIICPHPSG
jgi:transposase